MTEHMTTRTSDRARNAAALLGCLGLLGAIACSSASSAPASGASQTGNGGTGDGGVSTAASATEQVTCDKPSQTYMAGMSQKGASGVFTFVLVEASGGAIGVGEDTWTVKLLDASGNPVEGATFPTIKAWMPEHNHGWTGAMAADAGGGTYTISNLYLFMAGFWQITLDAQAGGMTDSTVFTFCLGDSN